MRRFLPLILLFTFVIHSHPGLAQDVSAEVVLLEDIAWSPDGTRIAGVYSDSHVAIWSVDDLSEPVRTFQAELADSVSWTADSQYLIAQGRQSDEMGQIGLSVTKWDADTGELSETLFALEMNTTLEFNYYQYTRLPVIAFDSMGTQAAFSFRNGTVMLSDGLNVLFLESAETGRYVQNMAWSPDNQHLAVIYGTVDTYTVQVIDVETGDTILEMLHDFQYYVTDLTWNAAGTHLATSSRSVSEGKIHSNIGIYEIEVRKPFYIDSTFWRRNIGYYGYTAPIDWHPTQYILAYADEDSIEIYNPDEPEPLFTLAVDEAKDIEWSPDGTQIASVSRDGELAIWDVLL